jgi:lipoprotein-anchoring transpeptidase ErfK/SrfK
MAPSPLAPGAAVVLGGCMQATLNPASDANFTARDKEQLTNPPYQQVWIPPAYQRQVVQYHRKETPGSILVDTDGRCPPSPRGRLR